MYQHKQLFRKQEKSRLSENYTTLTVGHWETPKLKIAVEIKCFFRRWWQLNKYTVKSAGRKPINLLAVGDYGANTNQCRENWLNKCLEKSRLSSLRNSECGRSNHLLYNGKGFVVFRVFLIQRRNVFAVSFSFGVKCKFGPPTI